MVTERMVADDWRCPKLSRVVHNVNSARKLAKFTDVTFVVGPDGDACTLKAHRVVLGTANDELAKLVSGSGSPLKIWIKDVSPKGFKNLIRFLYDIDVKFSDLSTVRETLLVAEKYKVYKLKLAAESFLNQAVKYESILEMLEIAIQFEMPKLHRKSIDIISTKYQDVLKSKELVSSPFEVVSAVLGVRPCHGEDCQSQALLAIGKWKKKHKADRQLLEYLLNCVDFLQVTSDALEAFVEENEGLLPPADINDLRKYKLTNKVRDAPVWHQCYASEYLEKNCSTNTEEAEKKEISKRNFSQHMELQKSKVLTALEEEMSYIDNYMKNTADNILEFHNAIINESVQEIAHLIKDTLKEGVEVTLECFEDDPGCCTKNEGEKKEENVADGEKESIKAASESDKLARHEYSSTKLSGIVPKCTYFAGQMDKIKSSIVV